jgi:hypothetical protein
MWQAHYATFQNSSFHGLDNEIYAEKDGHNLSPKFRLECLGLRCHGQGGAFP